MAITHIVRDYGTQPCIVRITTTDNYATISAAGYLTAQAANIYTANSGAFEWAVSDTVLVWYQDAFGNGAWADFYVNSTFTSLVPRSFAKNAVVTLTAAQVLAAYAAPQLLIPAPGAGYAIVIQSCMIVTQVSTAFAGGGVGHVQYTATVNGGGANALSATTPSAEITAASSQIYVQTGPVATTVLTGITNEGVYFSNATGAFTGGAGSTLTFVLNYSLVPAVV
jgi:hypothetical protein